MKPATEWLKEVAETGMSANFPIATEQLIARIQADARVGG